MSKSNFIVRGGGDFSDLYKEFNNAQKKMNTFQTSIGKAMKGIGALFGGIAFGGLVKGFTSTAMRTETLEVAMNSVARASGYATDVLNEHKKAVMDMGIAQQESMQILTRFMQAQLDTADASKLARVAQDAAVIANMNSSEAAEQMTEAIAKQRPELLSAFGMTKNMNAIYKDFGKTINKTANKLTDAEKKQAMLNYILEEGKKIAGTYEASMGAVGKQIGSLPRYWQTLQNAIATPLALPGLSVAVEAITNALKNATAWAEANKATLQRWGQSVTSAVNVVVKGFGLLTKAIAQNWNIIKFVSTALVSYFAVTKAVTAATIAWRIATLTLNGELMTKVPLLGIVSAAIGTYRLQMALAPVATNIFTAALLRLRVALYAIHTALGPVGWVMLAISAAISSGMAIWNKYTQSVNKANQSLQSLSGTTSTQSASSSDAADAIEDQADAIKEAGKAAKGSIAGFDELNVLQDNTAGSEIGNIFDDITDIPDIDSGIPDFDLDGMMEGLKPTLSGFWDWIKQGFSNIWEGVKNKWQEFINWIRSWTVWDWLSNKLTGIKEIASTLWDGVKENWSSFTTWVTGWVIWDWIGEKLRAIINLASTLWDGVKENWSKFIDWVASWKIWDWLGDKLKALKDFALKMWDGVKENWSKFAEWVSNKFLSLWDNIKVSWGKFANWTSNMWDSTKIKWNEFIAWATNKWVELKDNFNNIFQSIKLIAEITWNNIKEVWGKTVDWFSSKVLIPIKNAFKSTINFLIGLAEGFTNGFIKGINGIISALNTIKIDIPSWVPGIGGNSFGINIPSVPELSIPRLAKGAVIPPNSEFLAILGDQKRGVNIEAPLSTIVEAFNAALDSRDYGNSREEITINFAGSMAQFVRELKPYIDKESSRRGVSLAKGVI